MDKNLSVKASNILPPAATIQAVEAAPSDRPCTRCGSLQVLADSSPNRVAAR